MALKIAVLVKQVPDHEAIVQIKSATELEIEDRYVCSFFDEIAVESALTLKKSLSDVEIKAFSVGGKRAVEALKRAMAMGIDLIEQIGDDSLEGADPLSVATLLAASVKNFNPDIVLCGKLAGDDEMGAVGPMVSQLLGASLVAGAVALEANVDGKKVRVKRAIEGETWDVEAGFPVVVTAEKGLAEPHVPVVMRVMKAMRAKVPQVQVEELGVSLPDVGVRRLGYHPPNERPPVQMIETAEELARLLLQRGVLG